MHELPKLTYAFNALEPHIDARTMEIHHGKHHQAYVDNLNKALANEPEPAKLPVEDLLRGFATVPDPNKTADKTPSKTASKTPTKSAAKSAPKTRAEAKTPAAKTSRKK